MSEEEQRTAEDVFKELDDDNDGLINANQLLQLLPQCIDLGEINEETCENLISQVPNENGKINYESFVNLLNALQNQQQENEEEEQEEVIFNILKILFFRIQDLNRITEWKKCQMIF